ncbi:2-keto-3-deoxy-phosphogluconate aldolase [Flavobacterium cutihirudinis]|uniref:2-keto-3-deoxy-phosphogluconate aldolase n=1 Tax=Flavobacterium cutihirudinis TaxID=1265740 RepID=A0A3D9FRX1_9FLAO|nr:bifunctional 4-hydroxy-2-oxoglutarate aldolase/2-dehydro-3-deoxy-phosphogluconate aldolase [Flavobacterium cutihirudinis]RED22540.1 2-keto-3-deoxy-phosphogluconate aldolase [Flavobacterium cutihirudinis]
MSTIQNTIEVILKQGMLPLYFNADENKSISVLKALYKVGIRAIEYTNRGPEAVSNFKKLIEIRNTEMPDMLLGIGTIKNVAQAETYYNAGADFFISPGFVPEVAHFLIAKNLLYAPGCMTPTEIIAAENAGVKFIKLFPGNILGPDFMTAIKDIFPSLIFMPTGGVDTTIESISGWFNAGVSAVGMGSKLISKKLMDYEAYDTIEKETKRVLDLIETVKTNIS